MRQLCLKSGISDIFDLGDGVFEGVCAPSSIIISDRSSTQRNLRFYSAKESRSFEELKSIEFQNISYKDINMNSNNEFIFSVVSELSKKEGIVPLRDICNVFDSGLDYSRKSLGDAVFYNSDKPKSKKDQIVLKGRNIKKFLLMKSNTFLRHNWKDIEKN